MLSALLREIVRGAAQVDVVTPLPRPGDEIGRYEIVRELGRGGFGLVLEALDPVVRRRVALKLVRPGVPAGSAGAPGLEEAEAVGRLSHPNIVQLFDVGTTSAGHHLVFEYLEGEPLSARLEHGPLPLQEAVRVLHEVAKGVARAHATSVVHRDLKPSNVFLCSDGQVKVLDFGLALVVGRSRRAGGGTPGWMAPEQARDEPEDPRTDVWALGAILVRMLGAGGLADARRVLSPAPALERLLVRLLSKDPAGRPADAVEVARALEPIVRALAAPRWPRRLAWAAPLVLAGALVAWGALRFDTAPGHFLAALADVENRTGEPELDALAGRLASALERSTVIELLPRARLHGALREQGVKGLERIDARLAREAGLSTGADVLLSWSVARSGEVYALELSATDLRTDTRLAELEERALGKAGLLEAIGRLADATRRALKEPVSTIRAARPLVVESATPSFEAYRHYYRALELSYRLLPGRQEELRKALDIDPAFALAAYQLALGGGHFAGATTESRAAIGVAMRNLHRVSARDQLLIQGRAAQLAGREDDALEFYRTAAARFPDDHDVHFQLGDLLYHQRRYEESVPWFSRAMELDPGWSLPAGVRHLTDVLMLLGRPEEALALSERAASLNEGPEALFSVAGALFQLGRTEEAIASARRVKGTGPILETIHVDILMAAGRAEEAEREARALPEALGWLRIEKLVRALVAQGRVREGLALLGPKTPLARSEPARAARNRLWLHVIRGDRAAVIATAGELPIAGAQDIGVVEALAEVGALEEAERRFVRARETGARADCRGLPLVGCEWHPVAAAEAMKRFWQGERDRALEEVRVLARAIPGHFSFEHGFVAAEMGRDQEALQALREAERSVFEFPERARRTGQSAYLQARALERLGRTEAARAELARFSHLWRRADRDLPLLHAARTLAGRLGTSVP